MGKLILISGENNSGKSRFAEQLIGQMEGERYYIATMIPTTEENVLRIEKHRKQREQFGFLTIELPYQVKSAPVTKKSVVLLEDVSNLLANNMFEKENDVTFVFHDICNLRNRCKCVVAVTISGLKENGYDKETTAYIHSLNQLNQTLFHIADTVIVMEKNNPNYQKGKRYDFI